MIVLGIETSTGVSSVAIGTRDGILTSRLVARGRAHVEFLTPAIMAACADAGIMLSQIGSIAVGLGPGLFTGMRVGIATAKTMAHLLHIPLVGIASLDLLAFGVRHSPRLVCACIDAKRGEVFTALYRSVPTGVQRVTDYRSMTADAVVAELVAMREDVLFVGSGARAYRDTLAAVDGADFASVGLEHPRADVLVELAIPRVDREEFTAPVHLEPLYVRKSDAEIKWEERGVVIERPMRVKMSKADEERAGRQA